MCSLWFFIATLHHFNNLSVFSNDTEAALGSSASKRENQLWSQLGNIDSHYRWISLLSPFPPFFFITLPIPDEEERGVPQTVWSCACSDWRAPAAAEHYFLVAVVCLAFPQWSLALLFFSPTKLPPSRQVRDFSSLSHLTCNDQCAPKDTGGGKRTHRWCDALGLILLGGKSTKGTDGLTKGECLHCLPSKILTDALWVQPT